MVWACIHLKLILNNNYIVKRLTVIFVIAFFLNLIWENLHVFLYANYQGRGITELILLRATLFDAIFITIICLPFLFLPRLEKKNYWIIIIGVVLAVLIEWYALLTGRWSYNSHMPIIPFLNVGLTPTIQLALLGFVSFEFGKRLYGGRI